MRLDATFWADVDAKIHLSVNKLVKSGVHKRQPTESLYRAVLYTCLTTLDGVSFCDLDSDYFDPDQPPPGVKHRPKADIRLQFQNELADYWIEMKVGPIEAREYQNVDSRVSGRSRRSLNFETWLKDIHRLHKHTPTNSNRIFVLLGLGKASYGEVSARDGWQNPYLDDFKFTREKLKSSGIQNINILHNKTAALDSPWPMTGYCPAHQPDHLYMMVCQVNGEQVP